MYDDGMSGSEVEQCERDGLRERKKLATRRALGIAAMRLAIRHGLDNVLVDDIAAEAEVSARTFNNYFASKYEAICALAMERSQRVGDALRARPPEEPLIEAITQAVLEPYRGTTAPDKEWIDGIRLVIRSPALQGEYLRAHHAAQQTLARAIADRTGADLDTDMFPAIMAGAVSAAIQVAHERWLRADPPVALAPLIERALGELRFPLAGEHADSEFACVAPPRARCCHGPRASPRPSPPPPTSK
jgi:AcrR family transcriptional regulator